VIVDSFVFFVAILARSWSHTFIICIVFICCGGQ